jgi:Raf kinase inhibitor-like YbhB/YbcL family protein
MNDQTKTINTEDNLEANEFKEFKLTSPSFENEGLIPVRHTCDDQNTNPPLQIHNTPEGTQALVLLMEDHDAPNGTFDHWITFNLPANTTEIHDGHEPGGISGKGTSGNLDYFGPCPPDGQHEYVFTLFALSEKLDLEEGASKEEIQEAMQEKILAQTTLTGTYARN